VHGDSAEGIIHRSQEIPIRLTVSSEVPWHARLDISGGNRMCPVIRLLPSHDLELVIGLALFPLVILSHGGSLL
jgi:hypothetical protein